MTPQQTNKTSYWNPSQASSWAKRPRGGLTHRETETHTPTPCEHLSDGLGKRPDGSPSFYNNPSIGVSCLCLQMFPPCPLWACEDTVSLMVKRVPIMSVCGSVRTSLLSSGLTPCRVSAWSRCRVSDGSCRIKHLAPMHMTAANAPTHSVYFLLYFPTSQL